MSPFGRRPRTKAKLKRRILEEFIDRRIAKPLPPVSPSDVKTWFPEHEQSIATEAVMELLAGDSPIVYATPGKTVWLEDLVVAQDHLEELQQNYPHWFEE